MTFLASRSRGRRGATGVELQEGRIVGPDSITGPRARPEESPPDRRTLGDYRQAAWRSKRSHPKAENSAARAKRPFSSDRSSASDGALHSAERWTMRIRIAPPD